LVDLNLSYIINSTTPKRRVIKMIEEDSVMEEIRSLQILKNKSRHIIEYIEDFKFIGCKQCIVTEYCANGDLSMKIEEFKSKNETIPLDKVTLWVIEILGGLAFLHKLNIIHRDVKPQ
jgi:NIMA (never in mitosis gene a)-related kinase